MIADIRNAPATLYGDQTKSFLDTWRSQVDQMKQKFGESIEKILFPIEEPVDVPVVYIKKTALIAVLEFLRKQPGFDYSFLSDLTATDEEKEPRFEIVYNLYCPKKCRIRLKVRLNDGETLPSITGLWPAANWLEREVWDMFGVRFDGHPDLRRILMDERWVGHPLRKDYPLRGYQLFTTPEKINTDLLES